MAVITISTFSSFAGLLLAVRTLATDPDPLKRLDALARLATSGTALAAALRDTGLGPLAAEMERAAKAADAAFAHDGRAKEDARVLFWQVAPVALADPATLAAANLDAAAATDAMIAALRGSDLGRDFQATPLAEAYFRAVARATLGVMLDRAEFVASIAPSLWREALARQGITLETVTAIRSETACIAETTAHTAAAVAGLDARIAALTEALARSEEARAAQAGGVSERALLQLVRPIAEHVEDTGQALIELARAVETARRVQEEGRHGSNLGDFIDEVLRRTAALSARGEHRAALSELDAALAAEEAESRARQLRLLDAAIDRHVLLFDAQGAAHRIARRIEIETPDPDARFEALRRERENWFERGRDKGLNFDLEVAIDLARITLSRARTADQRGTARNDLGAALLTLGERESGPARLEAALTAYRAALEERTRDRVPLDWATTTGNLGLALRLIAERTRDLARVREARDAIASAESVLRAGGHSPGADYFARELIAAETLISRLEGRG